MTFELCNEHMADGKPFTIGAFYTNSLNEKAKLRAHIEAWRGRAFTEEELRHGFDIEHVLGKPCMLSIIANPKGRSQISAIAAMPKGMTAPPLVNKTASFWIEEWNQEVWDALPDGIKEIISKSDEYQARGKGNGGGLHPAIAEMSDDIPFADPYKGRLAYIV